jgi:hypothetical protein
MCYMISIGLGSIGMDRARHDMLSSEWSKIMTRPFSKTLALAAGLACAVLITAPSAQATIFINTGNHPQSDEENILFGSFQNGTLFTGTTNQTHTGVQFTSTANLENGGVGQAKLIGPGNTNILGGTSVTFTVPGGTFGDLIFNAAITGRGTSPGLATVSALDNNGDPFSLNTDLGHGSNFFTLTTDGIETITSVTITLGANTVIGQLAQYRVSGLGGTTVPEPASLVMLGSALLGFGVLRRRKT